ncbi:MAG: hypothetical protein JJT90_18480, partial [Ectothiorhodospiraceae bacterium]|nr:hypothetical protein [Ectothiorhodospiraceae bacterium]
MAADSAARTVEEGINHVPENVSGSGAGRQPVQQRRRRAGCRTSTVRHGGWLPVSGATLAADRPTPAPSAGDNRVIRALRRLVA